MGRPPKETVDYFPHDAVGGKTLFILQSRFGNNGYACWFKLLALLCRTPGHAYYCSKSSDWQFLVAEMALSEVETLAILDCLAVLDAIDPELWAEKIIWSQNLVNRISDAYINRKRPIPVKPTRNAISTPDNPVSTPDNPPKQETDVLTTPEKPQTKLKETKLNNTKNITIPCGIAKNVLLTSEEYKKLVEKFGEKDACVKIDKLSAYIGSKGKRYKSHYLTILNWAMKDTEIKPAARHDYGKHYNLPDGKELERQAKEKGLL